MENMQSFYRKLQENHLPRFQELPALELYKDQLVSLTNEYLSVFFLTEKPVTDTMVNNYVKLKVLAPPVKKRYRREHLARLVLICLLKRVLSIAEIRQLLERCGEGTIQPAYDYFCDRLEQIVSILAGGEKEKELLVDEIQDQLLDYAILSFVHKLWFELTLASRTDKA